MRRSLKLHPNSSFSAAARIEVGIAQPRVDSLMLSYTVTGNMNNMRLPPVMDASRSDNLWQHTCFEAFVRASSGAAYYEFNFSPSTQWAAYRFTGYRSGMSMPAEIGVLPIEVRSNSDCFVLQARLELEGLSGLPRNTPWHLGLSAVLEDTNGSKSYWALTHPRGNPDFHHADCFTHKFFPGVRP
jgi:hypothetical protein